MLPLLAPRPRRRRRRRVVAAVLLAALVLAPVAAVAVRRLRPPPDPLPRARLLLAGGDAAAAEAAARAAVELRPRDAVAWQLLGECLRARGRTEEADDAARRALRLAPDWEAPVVALVASALAGGRERDAQELAERAFDRGVSTAALLRLRARLRARSDDFASAADDLVSAARRRGGHARDLLEAAQMHRAAAFVAGTVPARSAELLDAAAARAAGEPQAADVLRAIAVERGDVDASEPLSGDDEHRLRVAVALVGAGRVDAARAALDGLDVPARAARLPHAAASLPPQDRVQLAALLGCAPGATADDVERRVTAAHLDAARSAAAGHRDALVVAHLRARVLRAPDEPDGLLALGLRLGAAQRADEALRVADQLPGGALGAPGRRLLGWYHVGAGEPARAASFLVPRGAPTPDPRLAAALADARVRGPAATAESAHAAAQEAPGDALPRLLLGLSAGHAGDDRGACVHLAAALARDPSLAIAANDLAWWLTTRGGLAPRALPLVLWARHLAPDDPHVRDTETEVLRHVHGAAPSIDPELHERTSR